MAAVIFGDVAREERRVEPRRAGNNEGLDRAEDDDGEGEEEEVRDDDEGRVGAVVVCRDGDVIAAKSVEGVDDLGRL